MLNRQRCTFDGLGRFTSVNNAVCGNCLDGFSSEGEDMRSQGSVII